jgi:stage V sporulation protein T
MRSTGIVRRIDDLGRVVIPKEIRRVLKIKEGDPLELYVNDGMVCFKKYAPDNLGELAEEVKSALGRLGIKSQVYDSDGDALTNAKTFHREVDLDSIRWYELANESGDTLAYVYAESDPTEFQKAQIEAVVVMAGINL